MSAALLENLDKLPKSLRDKLADMARRIQAGEDVSVEDELSAAELAAFRSASDGDILHVEIAEELVGEGVAAWGQSQPGMPFIPRWSPGSTMIVLRMTPPKGPRVAAALKPFRERLDALDGLSDRVRESEQATRRDEYASRLQECDQELERAKADVPEAARAVKRALRDLADADEVRRLERECVEAEATVNVVGKRRAELERLYNQAAENAIRERRRVVGEAVAAVRAECEVALGEARLAVEKALPALVCDYLAARAAVEACQPGGDLARRLAGD